MAPLPSRADSRRPRATSSGGARAARARDLVGYRDRRRGRLTLPLLLTGLAAGRRRVVSFLLAGGLIVALFTRPGLGPEAATANGVGDLYVATRSGVAEVLVATAETLASVSLQAAPQAVAFDPAGATLYAAAGGRIEPIVIESLETTAAIPLPDPAATIVHPKGADLYVALTAGRRLLLLDPATGARRWSGNLPGQPDLLAADRRHAGVLAAESGKRWLAFVGDEAQPVTTTLPGRVTAIAVSRAGDLLAATRAPVTVQRLTHPSLTPEWSVTLPSAPDALAAMADGVVAAAGRTLWRIDSSGAHEWRTLGAPVMALAVSDEGTVLYAATEAGLEAIAGEGQRAVKLALDLAPGPGSLAPVPRPASLAGSGGPSGSGETGRLPATSTAAPNPSPGPAVGFGLAVGFVVLVLAVGAGRWIGRERRS